MFRKEVIHLRHFLHKYPVLRMWTLSLSNDTLAGRSMADEHNIKSSNLLPLSYDGSSDLLNFVRTNHTKIDYSQIMTLINALYEKSRNNEISSNDINHPGFSKICTLLINHVRKMNPSEVIKCLKMLSVMKVDVNSYVVQTLLQFLRASINNLTLANAINLFRVLNNFESCPLTDALKEALPIYIKFKLVSELDLDDIDLMKNILRWHRILQLTDTEISIIVNKLNRYKGDIAYNIAISVIISLCEISYSSNIFEKLILKMQNIIIDNSEKMEVKEMIALFDRISQNIDFGNTVNYNVNMIEACLKTAMEKKFNFRSSIAILHRLNRFNYVNIDFLDYISDFYCLDQYNICDQDFHYTSIFLLGLVKANFKPSVWDSLINIIDKNKFFERRAEDYVILMDVLNLLALGHYDENLVSKILQTSMSHRKLQNQGHLLLYQAVKYLYSTTSKLTISEELYNHLFNHGRIETLSEEYSFTPHLKWMFGEERYVRTNVLTKSGHVIDYLIAFDAHRKPIAIDCDPMNNFLEQMNYTAAKYVILIVNLPSSNFSINTDELSARSLLYLRSLEAATGCLVVAINGHKFSHLSDSEQMSYLREKIMCKLPSSS